MSEPVRWGVLSTAQFALKTWLPALRNTPDSTGVAIASRDIEKARAAADQFGFARAYGSYEELLADPEIEAVYIPLPNGLHGEWSIRAAEAGKHVMVEKPSANDLPEARRMAEAARAANVRLMEAFVIRHHARWKEARRLVREGAIGQPVGAHGHFSFYMTDTDNVRLKPELAGGALADVGCYCVTGARFVFDGEPTHAFGIARDPRGFGVDTTFSGALKFPEADLTFFCSFEAGWRQAFTFIGAEGTLSLNRPFVCNEEPVLLTLTGKGGPREITVPLGDQYVDEIAHFNACVRDPEKPLWPGEDGQASAAALDALRRSAATGRLEPL